MSGVKSAGFAAATDYFSAGDALAVVTSSEGQTGQVATATDENGDELVRDPYGEVIAPTADYKLKGEVSTLPALGTVVAVGEARKVMIGTVSVTTAAGAEPTVSISGTEVEAGAVTRRTFKIDLTPAKLLPRHKAQMVLPAFTAPLAVSGCSLTQCDFEFSATVDATPVSGKPIYSDVFGGKVVCKATILQTGADAPTVTAGEGWTVTSPLASSSPETDYIEWTVELTRSLAVTEAVEA